MSGDSLVAGDERHPGSGDATHILNMSHATDARSGQLEYNNRYLCESDLTHLQARRSCDILLTDSKRRFQMSKKRELKRSTRTANTLERKPKRGEVGRQNLKPNLNGRPPKELCFSDIMRAELLKRKKFRRADGSIMETTELELIVLKIIRELRSDTQVSHKLLNLILDRIYGKPRESIDIDAKVETASSLDAKDILLQRIDKILGQSKEESAD